MERKKNISLYLGENSNRFFKIPAYQRGFKWGVLDSQKESAATILLKDIINAHKNGKAEYFIQGITVFENNSDVVLIDGQQRTTTLFLLLNLLLNNDEKNKYLFFEGEFKLKYEIRQSSQDFLKNHCKGFENTVPIVETQDVYYFKEVTKQLNQILNVVNDKEKLKEYILTKVLLFYVIIPEREATKVFSMMNGAKAFMKTDELIKADFLSKASIVNLKKSVQSKTTKDTLVLLKEQIGEDWRSGNKKRHQINWHR